MSKSAAVPVLAAPLGLLPLIAEGGLVKRILAPVWLVLRLERPESAHKVTTWGHYYQPSPQLILTMSKVTTLPKLTEFSLPELFAQGRLVQGVL